VKRDVAACRARDVAVPTRGQIRDIGPGVSHKAKVVQLYLWGLQFTDVESRTHHSEGAIRRYLADFRQIAALYARGAKISEIRAATGRSAALIAEYIGLYERARRQFPAAPRALRAARRRTIQDEKGGPAVKGPGHSLIDARRLQRRTLPSLLRYKFLREYGYDKGAVIVGAIVDDICQVVRNYYTRPGDLEAGQLIYHAPSATERPGRAKTIAQTKLVPVRLTIVADEDVEAIRAHLPACQRRDIRVRRLTSEAFAQGGVLSCADIAILTGYSTSAVSMTAVALRHRGEWLPLRGYIADMGSFPTHKAAIIRLYLSGLTTPTSRCARTTPNKPSTATSAASNGSGCWHRSSPAKNSPCSPACPNASSPSTSRCSTSTPATPRS
jgi:Protein of unknown function (DUF1670)